MESEKKIRIGVIVIITTMLLLAWYLSFNNKTLTKDNLEKKIEIRGDLPINFQINVLDKKTNTVVKYFTSEIKHSLRDCIDFYSSWTKTFCNSWNISFDIIDFNKEFQKGNIK